MRENNLFYFRS